MAGRFTGLFTFHEGGFTHGKDDISAQEETAFQGPRLPCKNEERRRTQGSLCKKSQGQSKVNRLVPAKRAAPKRCGFLCITAQEMELLKKNEDFRNCYRQGRSSSRANRLLVLYHTKNGLPYNRIGISVSKKVGNSVVRHRIKRLVREVYRLQEDSMRNSSSSDGGSDIVVVARRSANGASYHEIESAFLALLESSGLRQTQ